MWWVLEPDYLGLEIYQKRKICTRWDGTKLRPREESEKSQQTILRWKCDPAESASQSFGDWGRELGAIIIAQNQSSVGLLGSDLL